MKNNFDTIRSGEMSLIRSIKRRKWLLDTIRKSQSQTGEILEAKNINIKPSFDGFLQQFGNRKELKELSPQEIRAVYQKLFAILNRAETLESNTKPSTANISGIFNLWRGINTIIDRDKKEIQQVFACIAEYDIPFQSLTSMYTGRWFPRLVEVQEFVSIMQFCQSNNINIASITGMQAGRGIPDPQELQNLTEWCTQNNIELSFITGMQNGKGIPDIKKLENFISLCRMHHIDVKTITGKVLGIDASLELVTSMISTKK